MVNYVVKALNSRIVNEVQSIILSHPIDETKYATIKMAVATAKGGKEQHIITIRQMTTYDSQETSIPAAWCEVGNKEETMAAHSPEELGNTGNLGKLNQGNKKSMKTFNATTISQFYKASRYSFLKP
jgi:hypothetical protein